METRHTPLPWVATGLRGQWPNQCIGIKHHSENADGGEHAQINVLHATEEARRTASANAAIIVTAVNSHADLVAACEELISEFENILDPGQGEETWEKVNKAKAVLSQSKGGAS